MLEDLVWFFSNTLSSPVALLVLAGVAMMAFIAAIVVLAIVLA
jgi:hypothetical protein